MVQLLKITMVIILAVQMAGTQRHMAGYAGRATPQDATMAIGIAK